MRLVVAAVCAAVLGGCQASYKSAAGGSTSPAGYGKGVSRSLVFADEGILLGRLGLTLLGGAAAIGSVENVHTTSNTWTSGDKVITETTTSGTVNQQSAQNAQKILDTANGPRSNLSGKNGGLAGRLEIAGETLGGDTKGWQFDTGFNIRSFREIGPFWGMLRGYFGLGWGSFDLNNRALIRMDRGPVKFGDTEYNWGGAYVRAGVFLAKPPKSIKEIWGLETFGTLSANARGPSYVGIGERVQFTLVFAEVEMQMGGTSADERSYVLNIGAGFF